MDVSFPCQSPLLSIPQAGVLLYVTPGIKHSFLSFFFQKKKNPKQIYALVCLLIISRRLFSSLLFDCNLYLLPSRAMNQRLAINMSIRSGLRQRNPTTVLKKKVQVHWLPAGTLPLVLRLFFGFVFCIIAVARSEKRLTRRTWASACTCSYLT